MIMKVEDIKKGRKVWYFPHMGAVPLKAIIISDEVRDICGTQCAFIDIRTGCVGIDFLEER